MTEILLIYDVTLHLLDAGVNTASFIGLIEARMCATAVRQQRQQRLRLLLLLLHASTATTTTAAHIQAFEAKSIFAGQTVFTLQRQLPGQESN